MKSTPEKIVISGIAENEQMFSSDRGSWNVSRAIRDCNAGKHKLWLLSVADAYANNSGVEVDEAKVAAMIEDEERALSRPLISVMEEGKLFLIDGHHRLRALHRLDMVLFKSFVIDDAGPYIVRFNGSRHSPYKLY
jgi:hypothetical protein